MSGASAPAATFTSTAKSRLKKKLDSIDRNVVCCPHKDKPAIRSLHLCPWNQLRQKPRRLGSCLERETCGRNVGSATDQRSCGCHSKRFDNRVSTRCISNAKP